MNLTRTERPIIEAIEDGFSAIGSIAEMVYGQDDRFTRSAVRSHICNLRAKGVEISSTMKGHYELPRRPKANAVSCQRCPWTYQGTRGGPGPITALVVHYEETHARTRPRWA